jgi:hypothetical protein
MVPKVLKRLTWVIIGVFFWSSAALAAAPPQVLGSRQELPNHLVWLFSRQSELPLVTLELLIKAGTAPKPALRPRLPGNWISWGRACPSREATILPRWT